MAKDPKYCGEFLPKTNIKKGDNLSTLMYKIEKTTGQGGPSPEIENRVEQNEEDILLLESRVDQNETDIQGALSGFRGAIEIADTPTLEGYYKPIEEGTYSNAGGLVYAPEGVDEGFDVKFIKTDTTWVKNRVKMPMQDISGLATKEELNELEKNSAITVENKVINGDFSSTSGWAQSTGSVFESSGNVGILTGGNQYPYSAISQSINSRYETAKKFYIKVTFRVTNASAQAINIVLRNSAGNLPTSVVAKNAPNANEWYTYEDIITTGNITTPTDEMRIEIRQTYADIATATGKVLEVKEFLFIDIAQDFTPTTTLGEIKTAISIFPNSWFDGVGVLENLKSVRNKLDSRITDNAIDISEVRELATISISNKVLNGDFSKGLAPWVSPTTNYTIVIEDNTLTLTSKGIARVIAAYQDIAINYIRNKVIYLKATMRVRDSLCESLDLIASNGDGNYQIIISKDTPNIDEWYTVEGFFTVNNDFSTTQTRIRTRAVYNSIADADGKTFEVKNVLALDLAEFGEEPTLPEVQAFLSTFPNSWFDGFQTLKTLADVYEELKNNSGGGGSGTAITLKQPDGLLDNWLPISGTDNTVGPSRTLGYDGYLYFIQGLRVRKLIDAVTGESEMGVAWSGGYPSFMAILPSGIVYAVNVTDGLGNKGVEIRKAVDFQTEPTVMTTLTGGHTNRIACHAFTDGIQEIIMIGGYEQTKDIQRHMYLSKDGGLTFTNVKTTIGADNTYNWHFHSAAYDVYQGRLWIAEGDDPAARAIWYSENLGTSWTRFDTNEYQPTLIMPMPTKVVFGRDQGYPGLDSYRRQTTSEEIKPVTKLDDNLTFRKDIHGALYYPSEPYVKEGTVAYIYFGAHYPDGMNYIYATGDGAESWHSVYSSLNGMSGPIVVGDYIVGQSGTWGGFKMYYTPKLGWV